MPARLEHGRIIEATVLDRQGRNPKRRNLVIVSSTADINAGKPFWCVAVTGTLPDKLPDDAVLLPWDRNRHAQTQLTKRCAAMCEWAEKLTQDKVLRIGGTVPTKELGEIMAKIGSLPL